MASMNVNKKHPLLSSIYPWLICITAILFYCFNYFLRISPSTMTTELLTNLQINATQLGGLIAFYYYTYTLMQLPVGMIIDRFNIRFVLATACLFAVLGLWIFIEATSFWMVGMGRLLMGAATAFSYITVLKLGTIWLPANRFATVAGLTTACGMVMAIVTEHYLPSMVKTMGYKQALYPGLFFGLFVVLLIALIVHSRPKRLPDGVVVRENKPLTIQQLRRQFVKIISKKQMWLIGLVGCLFYLPASVFLELWGFPYLEYVYDLSAEQAGHVISVAFLGWIISGPTIGAISDKIKRRKAPLIIAGAVAAILLVVLFTVPSKSLGFLYSIFFFIGFSCGAHPLCFSLGKENNPIEFSGTAIAITNTLIMAGGVIFHPLVGKLLDVRATGEMVNNIPVYTASDYTYALSVIPIGLVISVFATFFIRETHCKVEHAFSDS